MKSFDTLYNEPRIYAYSLPEVGKLVDWLKVGYTDRQAALSCPEKVRQLVALQKRLVPIYAARGKTIVPWTDV